MPKINCYFNATGYYVTGPDIEIARSVEPLTDDADQLVFEELQHLYLVAFSMLGELVGREIGYMPIHVFNDSRIIDDMNGASSIDQFCEEVSLSIRRRVTPLIDGQLVFRKLPARTLAETIQGAQQKMLGPNDQALKLVDQVGITRRRQPSAAVQRLNARREAFMKEKYNGPDQPEGQEL